MNKFLISIFFLSVFIPAVSLAALPADLHFQYDRDGGIYPERTHVDLSVNGGVYQHYYNGVEQKVNFSVTQKEMNSLYNTFKWYFFKTIKIKIQETYDRGGDSLSWITGTDVVTKSNLGKSYINGALSRWRYDHIASAVNVLVQKKISAYYKPVTIEVESHLTKYTVQLAVNGKKVDNWENVKLLPGTNELTVALYNKQNAWVTGESFAIEIPEVKVARIQVRGSDISLSTE